VWLGLVAVDASYSEEYPFEEFQKLLDRREVRRRQVK